MDLNRRRPRSGRGAAVVTVVVVAVLVAVGGLTGCGGSVQVAGPTPARPLVPIGSPLPSPPPPLKTPSPPEFVQVPLGPYADASAVKEVFVALVTDYCGVAYSQSESTPPNPKRAKVRRGPTTNEWKVTDVNGDTFLVNVDTKRVYALDGPDGVLPATYTFGCDQTVFPGTWD